MKIFKRIYSALPGKVDKTYVFIIVEITGRY